MLLNMAKISWLAHRVVKKKTRGWLSPSLIVMIKIRFRICRCVSCFFFFNNLWLGLFFNPQVLDMMNYFLWFFYDVKCVRSSSVVTATDTLSIFLQKGRLYNVNSSNLSTKPCGIPCFNLNLYQSFSLGNRNWNNLIQLINDRCSNDPNKMLKVFGNTSSIQKMIDESSFRMCVIETAKWSQFDQRDTTSGPTAIPHDFTLNQTEPQGKARFLFTPQHKR